jgi:hypothetical protein
MKITTSLIVILLLISSCTNTTESKQESPSMNQTEAVQKQLRHIVLFKFKATAAAADIQKVESAFAALPSKIKEIKDFEWGLNNSPEGLNKEFTHCFFVTFESEADRAIYLPHLDHQAFVGLLDPILEDVLVIDYWAK